MSVKWRRILYPCRFAFCPTEVAFRSEMRRSSEPDFPFPTTDGCCVIYDDKNGDRRALVIINVDWNEEPQVAMGVLVHECVHVVEAMIAAAKDTAPSEEFRAYTTQAVFSELLSDISEYLRSVGYQGTLPLRGKKLI